MAKNRTALASRAWHLLRLALIWARKGGLFKQGLSVNLRIRCLPNNVRTLRGSNSNPYGHYEFSCDETPIFKIQKPAKHPRYLPRIPCISPPIDFDCDDCEIYNCHSDERCDDECDNGGGGGDCGGDVGKVEILEEEIDSKAEEFIARFYEGMRLQRQVSYLQYNEMLHRGVN